ncbi:MAG TPA: hypothetical protein VFA07_13550 [Chthonomonadaceae bacterium]|nr:hypothetical protein [Chthonomonadaceae bacterium]
MNLDARCIDNLREMVNERQINDLDTIQLDGITLNAILELVCCRWVWEKAKDHVGIRLFEKFAQQKPFLYDVWSQLTGDHVRSDNMVSNFGLVKLETRGIMNANDIIEPAWSLFEDRFRRSLIDSGFSSRLAQALAGAFHEMTDNVAQHSEKNTRTANGVAGYFVCQQWMTFSVADVGRGVLKSLHDNPNWRHLTNSKDALLAAVNEYASRRGDFHGDGFKEVHKALAGLNGLLRFRSGDGVLHMDGRSGPINVHPGFSPQLIGLQLSITCTLDKNLDERLI